MPISHRHRCIFIHVPRTAGSSIEEALLGLNTTGPARDVSNEEAFFGVIPAAARARHGIPTRYREWQHLPAIEVRRILPADEWQRYFKVTCVRNPWDRMVSWFCYVEAVRGRKGPCELTPSPALRERFGAWVRDPERNAGFLADGRMLRDQLDWITDERGTCLVDFVARYERLQDDFATLCRRFGVETELPHVRRSERAPIAAYYDATTREVVRERHARDIEAFGYTFEP